MFKATEGIVLPTTITGSLPRPHWYSENLGARNFREAMVDARFREQYLDTVATFIKDQETAGLDILTDGDARFDRDVISQPGVKYVVVMEGINDIGQGTRQGATPDNAVTADDLIAWCRERMANYKVPRRIAFVDAFPLNATGKVLKFRLREMAGMI